jgi:hypothetical protein
VNGSLTSPLGRIIKNKTCYFPVVACRLLTASKHKREENVRKFGIRFVKTRQSVVCLRFEENIKFRSLLFSHQAALQAHCDFFCRTWAPDVMVSAVPSARSPFIEFWSRDMEQ